MILPLAVAAVGAALFWVADDAADMESADPATTALTPTPTVPDNSTKTITQTQTQTETETETETETAPSAPTTPFQTSATSKTAIAAPQTTAPWGFPPERSTAVLGGTIVGTCDEGGSCGVKQRRSPFTEAPRAFSNDLPDGTIVAVICGVYGDTRSSRGYGTSNIWYQLVNGAYIPSVFVDIPTSRVSRC